MSVYDGPGVDTGGDAGDLGPGRGPGPVSPAPRDRGARQTVAGPAPELGHVPSRELLVIVQLEVGGQGGLLTGDSLAPGGSLQGPGLVRQEIRHQQS